MPVGKFVGINLALLKPLLHDPSRYVNKSVANHIHDLAKENKQFTFNWIEEQIQESENQDSKLEWIVRYGLRTLLKSHDEQAHILYFKAKGLENNEKK